MSHIRKNEKKDKCFSTCGRIHLNSRGKRGGKDLAEANSTTAPSLKCLIEHVKAYTVWPEILAGI